MPRGPSVVRTVSAIATQALMLCSSWPLPCEVSVPSRSRIMPGCCKGKRRSAAEFDQPAKARSGPGSGGKKDCRRATGLGVPCAGANRGQRVQRRGTGGARPAVRAPQVHSAAPARATRGFGRIDSLRGLCRGKPTISTG